MVVGVGGRSSFISPCSSGTWIDLRRDWSLQGFSVLALEHGPGAWLPGWLCQWFWSDSQGQALLVWLHVAEIQKSQKVSVRHFYLLSYHVGGAWGSKTQAPPNDQRVPCREEGSPRRLSSDHADTQACLCLSLLCQFKAEAHRSPCV